MAVDWTAIESDYITGTDSYCELSNKYNVCRKNICQHGKDGNWVQKRAEYRKNKIDAIQDATIKAETENGLICIRKLQEIAVKALERCDALMETCATQRQACDLMDAVNTAKNIVRDVYGLPNLSEAAAMETARRKVDIEERKAAREDVTGEQVKIIIEGAEDYSG